MPGKEIALPAETIEATRGTRVTGIRNASSAVVPPLPFFFEALDPTWVRLGKNLFHFPWVQHCAALVQIIKEQGRLSIQLPNIKDCRIAPDTEGQCTLILLRGCFLDEDTIEHGHRDLG